MKNKLFLFGMFLALIFPLAACGGGDTPKPTPVGPGKYYNEENFIKSSKSVETTKLVTYEGPSLLETSKDVSVKVEGKDLFVYETKVNHERVWGWKNPDTYSQVVNFDFEGKVKVDVTINKDIAITSAVLRPQVYGLQPTISGKTISFYLTYSGNYVLEYNDDYRTAIHIFANEIEKDPISEEQAKADPNIIYVGPGLYKAGAIPTKENATIYLAGGAYVYGQIRAEKINNLTIRGRGIISGSIYTRNGEADYTIPVVLRSVNNVLIEGITFLDPAGWALNIYNCENVEINNVKIITARSNGDGISLQSCRNVRVNGGYVRTWDDSLVVKNVDELSTENIKFNGVVIWTDLAQSMEVGYETFGAKMNDITFENIIVLHNFHKALISCHNSDNAEITNLTYKNIILEDGQMLGDDREDGENDFFIDFTIAYSPEWTKSKGERGSISGVTIENVKVYKLLPSIVSRMLGEGEHSAIKNVTIKGIEIEDKIISNIDELKLATNKYVGGVGYTKSDKVLGAFINLPYNLDNIKEGLDYKNVPAIAQEGILVPDFAIIKGDPTFLGTKLSGTFTTAATHGAGTSATSPFDDGSGDFTKEGSSSSYAVDNNDNTAWESKDWKNEEDEFAALSITFDNPKYIGIIRVKADVLNNYSYTYKFSIFAIKEKSTGGPNDKYTRIASSKEYDASPSKGNLIDINISANTYYAIQFRFYHNDGPFAPKHYKISEVEFYAPSLSFGKAIVDSTPHNDVYNVERVVDGDPTGTSYYESASLPAHIVIDMKDIYKVSDIVLNLPPSLQWDARNEEIEILASDYNFDYDKTKTTFKTVVEKQSFLFDPQTGNKNHIHFDTKFEARYIKVVIYSNDISGGYKAQLSEISVYGEK